MQVESSAAPRSSGWASRVLQGSVLVALAAQVAALFLPLSEPDEALYAVLSRELSASHQWAALTLHGETWLDKPHFPFWCAALSMRLFGASAFTYRLPAFLFYLFGVGAAAALGRRFFSGELSRWTVVASLTAFHLILSNHDVRAEPYLLGLTLVALYLLALAMDSGSRWQALAAGVAVGCAIISKGPFVLVPTAGALLVASALGRRWLRPTQVLALGVGLAGPIAAEFVALRTQFGEGAPGAIANLFWAGQLNRFNGAPVTPEAGWLYYVHTLAWAFAPWYPSLLTAAVLGARALWRGPRAALARVSFAHLLVSASAALAFLAFSLSHFQLPYYLNFELPVFALLAGWVVALPAESRARRITGVVQVIGAAGLLVVAAFVLLYAAIPHAGLGLVVLALPALALVPRARADARWPWVFSAATGAAVAVVFNGLFFPWLSDYESGYQAALEVRRVGAPAYSLEYISYAYDFYAAPEVPVLKSEVVAQWKVPEGSYIYLWPADEPKLAIAGLSYEVVRRFGGTAISQPRKPFLDPATRASALRETLLVRVK